MASISALDRFAESTFAAVTTGLPITSSGQRHSSETPTSESTSPSSAMISVALGSSEQTRMRRLYRVARRALDRRRGDAQRRGEDHGRAGADRGAAAPGP